MASVLNLDDQPIEKPRLIIYTDGSSRPKTIGTAGWAFAFTVPNDPSKTVIRYGHIEAPATNNQGELMGVLEALRRLINIKHMNLHFITDSQYVQKGLTEWRASWERRGLRNNTGTPIKNKAIWKEIFSLWDAHGSCSIEWVRGHSGNEGNELVDKYANMGSDNIPLTESVSGYDISMQKTIIDKS